MLTSDNKFMLHALKLAALGGRSVAPNPMVGAVIVKNKKIIGEGYHKQFGGPHAEVNAIKSVKNKKDLLGSTIYVTLEPCRHHGKTPPCADLIESVGITKIVCGSEDPFQKKFITNCSYLTTYFLKGKIATQCRNLNKFYYKYITTKIPFITVKIAISSDGFVAGKSGTPVHISSKKQDIDAHKLRASHQAIMVGINTVINDDPYLNVRHAKGKDPLRIVLDSKLRMPLDAKVLKDKNVLVVTTLSSESKDRYLHLRKMGVNIWVSPTKKHVCFRRLFKYLASLDISSVLVEPGPTLYKALKKQNKIDELIIFRGTKKLKEGLKIDL